MDLIAKAIGERDGSPRRTDHPSTDVPGSWSWSRVIVFSVGLVIFAPSVFLVAASLASLDRPSASFYVVFLLMATVSGWMMWASAFGRESTVRGILDGL